MLGHSSAAMLIAVLRGETGEVLFNVAISEKLGESRTDGCGEARKQASAGLRLADGLGVCCACHDVMLQPGAHARSRGFLWKSWPTSNSPDKRAARA